MMKRLLVFALMILLKMSAMAQGGFAINTTGTVADGSSILDVSSTTRGMLAPRMSTVQRDAISLPATGLLIYNTTVACFQVNKGTPAVPVWECITTEKTAWNVTGNNATIDGTNFLGTIDNVPLTLRVFNQQSGRVDNSKQNASFGFQSLFSNTSGNNNVAFGDNAGRSNTTGFNNVLLGSNAGYSITVASSNIAIGTNSLHNQAGGSSAIAIGTAALYNCNGGNAIAIGDSALYSFTNSSPYGNTAIGIGALKNTIFGSHATAVGYHAGYNNTSGTCSYFGSNAGYSNTVNTYNCFFGVFSGYALASGGVNCFFGSSTGQNQTSGNFNSYFGHAVALNKISGDYNSFFGAYAGLNDLNNFGSNILLGYSAGYNLGVGSGNVIIGNQAGYNSAGYSNVFIGDYSGRSNANSNNVGIGYITLYANTSGTGNTAVGAFSLDNNTIANSNTAVGQSAGGADSTASRNTAIGYEAMRSLSYSNGNTEWNSDNTAIGYHALYFNQPTASTNGYKNTATGTLTLLSNTTGYQNTANGWNSLSTNTTGYNNTAVGNNTMTSNFTGINNTVIGAFADVSNVVNNATAIGYNAKVTLSNSLILGGTNADAVNVGMGTTSPSLAKLQVEGMVGNTVGIFRNNAANSWGMALVSDWPGIYFNCYFNVSSRAMGGTGFPAIINCEQNTGGITFQATNTANTLANAAIAIPERMRITGAGNVGIGTGSPGFLLEVNGTAGKPGGGAWTASSDARLKKDIVPYTDGLTQLLKINPVRFHYNELSGYNDKPEYVGVIAQDLQKVVPYMVGTFKKDSVEYLNVDNSAMTYMLINSVKEQQQTINDLKKQLLLQQKDIDDLKKLLKARP